MTNPPSIAGQDSLEGLANDVRLISDDLITLPVPKARLREAADTIVRLRGALAPFAHAATYCRIPVAQNAAQWLAWEDFERALEALTTTKIEKDAG